VTGLPCRKVGSRILIPIPGLLEWLDAAGDGAVLAELFPGRLAITPDELWRSGVVPLGRGAIYEGCRRYLASRGGEW
jgi:hypothetical protein